MPPLTLELFHRYEIQQKEPSIWVALHTRGPSLAETVLEDHSKPLVTRSEILQRLLKACTVFEQALLRLRNLHRLVVDSHQYEYCNWIGYGWRCKRWLIHPEVAPLAFLLRVLGRRSYYSNSLTSLQMTLDCKIEWSLDDLPLAWISPESIGYEDDEENRNEDAEENRNEDGEENDDEDDNEDDEGNNDEDDDGVRLRTLQKV